MLSTASIWGTKEKESLLSAELSFDANFLRRWARPKKVTSDNSPIDIEHRAPLTQRSPSGERTTWSRPPQSPGYALSTEIWSQRGGGKERGSVRASPHCLFSDAFDGCFWYLALRYLFIFWILSGLGFMDKVFVSSFTPSTSRFGDLESFTVIRRKRTR